MYLSVHSSLSLVVGVLLPHPLLAFVLALILHTALDTIPHDGQKVEDWRKKGNKTKKIFLEAVLDFFVLFTILFILFKFNKFNFEISILAALVGGILPDILWGLNVLTKKKNKFLNFTHKLHDKIHFIFGYNFFQSTWVAMGVQILVLILGLIIYLKIY